MKPGTAKAYARECIAQLQKAGLANEPEFEEIPFDSWHFNSAQPDPYGWMGSTSL
jgi:hypothetical protein